LPDASLAMALPTLGFVLWLFGFARRSLGATSSYGLLALCFVSPDFNSFTFYPLTNGFVTLYAAVALLYAYEAARGVRGLMGIVWVACLWAVWSRAEAAVFVTAVVAMLLIARPAGDGGGRGRSLERVIPWAILGSAALLIVAWNAYTATTMDASGTDRLIPRPYWDAARAKILVLGASTVVSWIPSMGLATWAAIVSIASFGVRRLRRSRAQEDSPRRIGRVDPVLTLWAGIGIAFVLYALLFYQADPRAQDSLESLLRSSFRRGVTAFVVPMWFAALLSPPGVWTRRVLAIRFARVR
jgi:hypothetical protein